MSLDGRLAVDIGTVVSPQLFRNDIDVVETTHHCLYGWEFEGGKTKPNR